MHNVLRVAAEVANDGSDLWKGGPDYFKNVFQEVRMYLSSTCREEQSSTTSDSLTYAKSFEFKAKPENWYLKPPSIIVRSDRQLVLRKVVDTRKYTNIVT